MIEHERGLLVAALQETGGNQSAAARFLGLPRRTFVYKMTGLSVRGSLEGYAAERLPSLEPGVDYVARVRRKERELVLAALAAASGNRTAAARKLGISARTLRRKLKTIADRREIETMADRREIETMADRPG